MRQCAEISRTLEVLRPGPTMAHLCCHSRGPTKRENQPAALFFSARTRQRRAPFTVAKNGPRGRVDSLHSSIRRINNAGEGEGPIAQTEWRRKVRIEKSRLHDPPFCLSSRTTAASAFQLDDRFRNESKERLRNTDSSTISRLLRAVAGAFGYGSLKFEAWMRIQVMYGVPLKSRRLF